MKMCHRPTIIYVLADPKRKTIPRYIGKTGNKLVARLSQHINCVNRYRTRSASWIKSLLRKRVCPVIWPLEVCGEDNWQERERYWIAFFRPLNTLTNTHPGGVGSHVGIASNDQIREKMRLSRLGKKLTQEQKVRRKWLLSRFKRTENQKAQFERMMKTRKLPTCSLEAIERGRRTKTGRPATESQKRCLALGINATMRGVTCLSTGKEFKSISDAGRSIGIEGSKIGISIARNGTCGGLIWAYTDELIASKIKRKTNNHV